MADDNPEKIGVITKKKIIITEGKDAKLFLIHLLNKKGNDDIQIIDSKGITELTRCLDSLKNIDGFDDVTSMLIFRDSETSSKSAIQSVNHSLKATGLITTEIKPFTFSKQNNRRIGFVLFPGIDENGKLFDCGTLEHLCLSIFRENANSNIVQMYIKDFQNKTANFKRPHKNELHALFSFTDKYVSLKLGETAQAGGFDFDSPQLLPFLEMIDKMETEG
jgi:hypothetical protein